MMVLAGVVMLMLLFSLALGTLFLRGMLWCDRLGFGWFVLMLAISATTGATASSTLAGFLWCFLPWLVCRAIHLCFTSRILPPEPPIYRRY